MISSEPSSPSETRRSSACSSASPGLTLHHEMTVKQLSDKAGYRKQYESGIRQRRASLSALLLGASALAGAWAYGSAVFLIDEDFVYFRFKTIEKRLCLMLFKKR